MQFLCVHTQVHGLILQQNSSPNLFFSRAYPSPFKMERRASRRLSLKARLVLDEQAQRVPAAPTIRLDKAKAIDKELLQPSSHVGDQVAAIPSLNHQFQWVPLGMHAGSANREVVGRMNTKARIHFDRMGTTGILHGDCVQSRLQSLSISCSSFFLPLKDVC